MLGVPFHMFGGAIDTERKAVRKPMAWFTAIRCVRSLFSFHGAAGYGELSYSKGDAVLIFCEDMSEGWSLGMLVDAHGNEVSGNVLSRGLIARGFYEVHTLRMLLLTLEGNY